MPIRFWAKQLSWAACTSHLTFQGLVLYQEKSIQASPPSRQSNIVNQNTNIRRMNGILKKVKEQRSNTYTVQWRIASAHVDTEMLVISTNNTYALDQNRKNYLTPWHTKRLNPYAAENNIDNLIEMGRRWGEHIPYLRSCRHLIFLSRTQTLAKLKEASENKALPPAPVWRSGASSQTRCCCRPSTRWLKYRHYPTPHTATWNPCL